MLIERCFAGDFTDIYCKGSDTPATELAQWSCACFNRISFFIMVEPVSLKCPNCAAILRMEDLDMNTGTIKCGYCHSLSRIPVSSLEQGGFHPRPEIPLPAGMQIQETMGGTMLSRRWFSPAVLFLIPFCIAWDSFLIFWYSMALSGKAPWIMAVFPIAHVAVGLGLTYYTLATLFNTTAIVAGRGNLGIQHGPLPWMGNVDLPTDNLNQLYCKEKINRGKNGPNYQYELWAATNDGGTRKLLGAGLTMEQALFIEQKLEHALGLKDRAMAGELPR